MTTEWIKTDAIFENGKHIIKTTENEIIGEIFLDDEKAEWVINIFTGKRLMEYVSKLEKK